MCSFVLFPNSVNNIFFPLKHKIFNIIYREKAQIYNYIILTFKRQYIDQNTSSAALSTV